MREIEHDMKPVRRGLLSRGRGIETVGELTGRILKDLSEGLRGTEADSEAYWRGLGEMYSFLDAHKRCRFDGGISIGYDDLFKSDCIIAIMHSNAYKGRGIDSMASREYLLCPRPKYGSDGSSFRAYMFDSPWGPGNNLKLRNIARYRTLRDVIGAFSVFRIQNFLVDDKEDPSVYFPVNEGYTRFQIFPEDPARDFIDRLIDTLNHLIEMGGTEPCW